MGKSSNSSSSSTTKNMYGDTTTTNPFYKSHTDKNGNTTTNFVKGTAGEIGYNYVNNNLQGLLDSYMNPSLDDPVNKARMDLYNKNLSKTAQTQMQNNIISPLVRNNMLTSSQATNMYNNMYNQMNDSMSDYSKELIANSRSDTWDMINNLVNLYSQAYQGASSNQNTSLNASSGNSTTKTTSNSNASA